jgi:hypothetical protein
MPHITPSRVRTESPTSQSVIPAAGPLAPVAAGVDTLLAGQNVSQKTVALGVRWQCARNADLKLQWDRINLPAMSYRHSGTRDFLPGDLLLVGVFANDVFDEFYPLINVTRIDDNRPGYDVGEGVHPHLLVKVKDLHRKIALEPETLTV